jgi:hypothetical protein
MELTEKERLLLVEKKEEIRRLTEDIIELTVDLQNNKTELKKRVTGILSLISTIASYTSSKNPDMREFVKAAQLIFYTIETNSSLVLVARTELEIFCNVANSIMFNFTKKDFKVTIQKIDFSIFRTGQ